MRAESKDSEVGKPRLLWGLPCFVDVVAVGGREAQPVADGFDEGFGDSFFGAGFVLVGEEPFFDVGIVHEFDFEEAHGGVVEVGVLTGKAEHAEAVLAIADVAVGGAALRIAAEGLQGGGGRTTD